MLGDTTTQGPILSISRRRVVNYQKREMAVYVTEQSRVEYSLSNELLLGWANALHSSSHYIAF